MERKEAERSSTGRNWRILRSYSYCIGGWEKCKIPARKRNEGKAQIKIKNIVWTFFSDCRSFESVVVHLYFAAFANFSCRGFRITGILCVVNPGHQFVGFGGDDGERRKDCSRCRIHPLTPQSGKSKSGLSGISSRYFVFLVPGSSHCHSRNPSAGTVTAVAQDASWTKVFREAFPDGHWAYYPEILSLAHEGINPHSKADSGRFAGWLSQALPDAKSRCTHPADYQKRCFAAYPPPLPQNLSSRALALLLSW